MTLALQVVQLVDDRLQGSQTQYLVRWKGLSSNHDSWVPEHNLTCPRLIADYKKTVKSESEEETVNTDPEEEEYEVGMGRWQYKH